MNKPDEQLVGEVLGGNDEAYGILVERHQRKALAVAGRLLSNVADSQEVVQEAFIKAYQSLDQLKDAERFGAWLMRIVVTRSLNFREQRSRRKAVPLDESFTAGERDPRIGGAELTASVASPQEQLIAQETGTALAEAIESLPDNLRVPLLLFAVEKVPQQEIAEITGRTLATIKWSVFEARRQLRKILSDIL
ncbi:MAG: sigma-70 family RNA polymerase sigma factor [Sedimentisphaerales bacterium]|nr:sigma-70 family RNA polymerase sigma factor [Sedimentisphaerales bacterium]